MPCSFCKNPHHTIRNCNSVQIRNVNTRIKSYANNALIGNRYDENAFIERLQSFSLNELKVSCIHWKRLCDPEILDDIYIPDIRSDLNYNTYKSIAVWLFLYVEHKYNEMFLQFSRNPVYQSHGFKAMQRRRYWRNIGLLNMNQDRAQMIYNVAIHEYNVAALLNQASLPILRQNTNNTQSREPRKFDIDVRVCSTTTSCCECPICYDEIQFEKKIQNQCGHSVCLECFEKYMDTMIPKTSDPCCSICRSTYKKIEIYSQDTFNLIEKYVL